MGILLLICSLLTAHHFTCTHYDVDGCYFGYSIDSALLDPVSLPRHDFAMPSEERAAAAYSGIHGLVHPPLITVGRS